MCGSTSSLKEKFVTNTLGNNRELNGPGKIGRGLFFYHSESRSAINLISVIVRKGDKSLLLVLFRWRIAVHFDRKQYGTG